MFSDFDKRVERMDRDFDRRSRNMFRAWLAGVVMVFALGTASMVGLVFGILWCLQRFGVIGP